MTLREQYIAAARRIYADPSNDDIEIDDHDVAISEAESGCWVAAWVWVADDDTSETVEDDDHA